VSGQKTVLIVDDDEIVRLLLAKLAEKCGARPTCVSNGAQAREIFAQGIRFDLICLDLIMPDASGWDILATKHATEAVKDIPVVVLTGAALSDDERGKLLEKAKAVVDKRKLSIPEFEALLARWL
jgi:CheY-like chemotaxis protein